MRNDRSTIFTIARKLADLYDQPFGGKLGGRYRISPKNLRRLSKRRRLSDEFVRQLAEEMFEQGYVFLALETFYVVSSARSFNNYRRLSDALVDEAD